MNSFISWIGGKKLLRKRIIEEFPEKYDRYIEVFGGAGWVLFGLEKPASLEVFNDIDSELINLYKCIKHHPEALQKELEHLFVSREIFNNYRDSAIKGLTDIQRAARYFYLIKVSFGADKDSFGTSRKNLYTSTEYLSQISDRLKNTVIENRDFSQLIKTYDRETALFYCDPPYYGTEKYYDNDFKEQHILLKNVLSNLKGKFVLSYNDCEYIRELYKEYNIIAVNRNHNLVSKNEKGRKFDELIIKNY